MNTLTLELNNDLLNMLQDMAQKGTTAKEAYTVIKIMHKDMSNYDLLPLLAYFVPVAEFGLNADCSKFAKQLLNLAVKDCK
jgi:hypothetical protein